jgi:elongation factor Ts
MAITAQDVNKLRQMTGAGMMDCKVALTEANGDFDTAIEILRKKGQKISEKRADRETTEGIVYVRSDEQNTEAVLIALGCETDFVSKNEEFQSLGSEILGVAYASKPADLAALLALKSGSLSLGEKITELMGKIGEKIEVLAYEKMKSELVVSYIHGTKKLGVLVALEGAKGPAAIEAGRDVAMQIAAMKPVSVDRDDVDPAIVQKELEIGREQARAEGKPENMLDKIAEGKLNKFFKESTLLSQAFVKDGAITVAKYLQSVDPKLRVSAFKRIAIG